MSPTRFVLAPRAAAIRARIRRKRRAPLICETLEGRQLLSTGAVATSTAALTAQTFLQVQPMAGGGASGYSPQQIDSAYGISGLSLPSGATQPTIAIVDAYNDPDIASDLAAFDAKYGLSAPPSFTVDNLGATTTNAGWAVETALDVEWAHAIAPQANIVLVEASSASLNSLLNAVSTAAKLPNVSVVSMSWGTSEYYGEWNNEGVFNTPAGHTSETFVAASGDSGAWSGPTFPSVSPNVLAVGGSMLSLGSGSSYGSETGWTDSTGGFSGLDNGFRYGLSIPSYQVSTLTSAGLDYGLRTTPDVSFNADPSTGVAVYDSVPYNGTSGWFDVGGTSAAAPSWAGLVALTDQGLAASGKGPLSTSQLLADLYSLPSTDFHDVTTGFNGYSAGTGYDLVTGLGTPKANLLVPALLAANGVTTSTPTAKASPASQQATTKSVASHNAVVASSASTNPVTVAGTFTVTTSTTSSAMAALPSLSLNSTTSAGGIGQASQAAPSSASSSGTTGTTIGLGQGTSSPSASIVRANAAEDEIPLTSRAAIDTGTDVETARPESPRPDAPVPQPSPTPAPEPGGLPAAPAPFSFPSAPDRVGITVAGLNADGPAVRLEPNRGREEESRRMAADEGGGFLAGMAAASLVATLGARVVLGRGPQRRPLTAIFRASER